MGTLFDIVGEFKLLYEIATEEDEEVFRDTLEGLSAELEVKSAGYVAVINQLEMEEKRADELSKKYAALRDSRKAKVKAIKDKLLTAMDELGKDELQAGDFAIKVQKNGGVQPLAITGEVPESMMKVTVEPDKAKIREYLKDNECEWAHLEERGRRIAIKEG